VGTTKATRTPPRLAAHLPTAAVELVDGAELDDVTVSADLSGRHASDVELTGCRLEGALLTATRLRRGRLTDCILAGCDLSGLVLEDSVLTRVEFRECRVSGLQAAGSRFRDVAFVGCRMNDANFRMTTWERAEFDGCDLVDADFYAAALPAGRFLDCDLTGVDLTRSTLTGARLQRSVLDNLKGASALAGVTMSSDQIIPAALAIFAALGITIDDGEPAAPPLRA
jgi:uncharacterized protein YjbI with pentapeptide repeats